MNTLPIAVHEQSLESFAKRCRNALIGPDNTCHVWLNFIVHFQTTNKHIEQSGGVAGQCRAPLITAQTGKRLISGLDATLVWMPAAELLNVFFIK
jgi:hypothetical protein